MKNKSFLFISCEDAKHICDKSQYNEATLWEKIKLNIRYIWCHITRAYVNKNKQLTKSIKKSKVTCLNQKERHTLNEQFQQELKNQQQQQP